MAPSNLRAFAIAGAVIVSASTLSLAAPKGDAEGVAKRIAPVARVELAPANTGAAAGNRSGEDIYKAICGACHDSGVANAPKLGDKAAWAPRLKLGLDGLVKSAITGKNAMPPKGGSDADDIEMTRVVAFMANKSGASFKEPAAK